MFPLESRHSVSGVPRLREGMIKGKSVDFLLLRLKANTQQFNIFTKENQTAFCRSMNFLPHSPSVLQKTIPSTLANSLNF